MNVGEGLFVTPHAVTQFQLRIAALDEAAARDVILAGIREATNVSVLPDGVTLRVRTKRPFPFEFRAYVVFDKRRGHRVVTTNTRGDSSVARKRRRKGREAVARSDA
jgi:predicted nucleotidyltransferase